MNKYDLKVISVYIKYGCETVAQCNQLLTRLQQLKMRKHALANQNIDTLIAFYEKEKQEVDKISDKTINLADAYILTMRDFNKYYTTFLKETHFDFADKLSKLDDINNDAIKRLEFLTQETEKNKIVDILKELNLKKKIQILYRLMFDTSCSLADLVKKENFAAMLKEIEEVLFFFEKQQNPTFQAFQEIKEDVLALQFLKKQVSNSTLTF
jgi:hypothetical protein